MERAGCYPSHKTFGTLIDMTPESGLRPCLIYLRDCLRAARSVSPGSSGVRGRPPGYAEGLWISPGDIAGCLRHPVSRRFSARVADGDWDRDTSPIEESPKIRYCLRHWAEGLDWEASGALDYHMRIIAERGQVDGCRTRDEVEARLARLDALFETVRREGRLAPKSEVRRPNFRESGGIYMHFDREGRGVFGLGGNHRLGIALAAGVSRIPVQVGQVHPLGLPRLDTYRMAQ